MQGNIIRRPSNGKIIHLFIFKYFPALIYSCQKYFLTTNAITLLRIFVQTVSYRLIYVYSGFAHIQINCSCFALIQLDCSQLAFLRSDRKSSCFSSHPSTNSIHAVLFYQLHKLVLAQPVRPACSNFGMLPLINPPEEQLSISGKCKSRVTRDCS